MLPVEHNTTSALPPPLPLVVLVRYQTRGERKRYASLSLFIFFSGDYFRVSESVSIAFVPRSYRLYGGYLLMRDARRIPKRSVSVSCESPGRDAASRPRRAVSNLRRRFGYCESWHRQYFTKDRPFIARHIGSRFMDTRSSVERVYRTRQKPSFLKQKLTMRETVAIFI